MNSVRALALMAVTLALAGCANGYKDFYRANAAMPPEVIARSRAAPAPATPLVERGRPGDVQAVLDAHMQHGYVMIGSSQFNSGRSESDAAAIKQGAVVGADLVLLLDPHYTGSVTTSVPLTTPTTSTTYSSGTATAYGGGQSVTAYGNGTSTTYGTTTTMIPVTVNRSDYGAVYFIKVRMGLGVWVRELNDAERQQTQSNKGVVILVVRDDSPAFEADLLKGDMLVSVDGKPISGRTSFSAMIVEHKGKQVTLEVMRGGQRLEKKVTIPA